MSNSLRTYYIIDVNPDHQKYSAALNRVKSFNKGFVLNNNHNEIILINKRNYKNRCFRILRAMVLVFFKLLSIKKNGIVIFYSDLPYYIFIPIFKHKIKFLSERNEYPFFLRYQNIVTKDQKKKEEKKIKNLKYFEGLITCSNALATYYMEYMNRSAKIFISPLIVDLHKINNLKNYTKQKENYFAYCGSLAGNKDGVPILIDSFALFAQKIDNIKLYIIGNAVKCVESTLKEKVNKLGLSDRIIFTGALPHDEMIPILHNASLLLLSRPNNKQAEGGIPSKIGEYMATKVPMVLTKVGELDSFLVDNYNCFFAEPDSVESFYNRMLEAFLSDNKQDIANNAYETVKYFDVKEQSKLLYDFCISL